MRRRVSSVGVRYVSRIDKRSKSAEHLEPSRLICYEPTLEKAKFSFCIKTREASKEREDNPLPRRSIPIQLHCYLSLMSIYATRPLNEEGYVRATQPTIYLGRRASHELEATYPGRIRILSLPNRAITQRCLSHRKGRKPER